MDGASDLEQAMAQLGWDCCWVRWTWPDGRTERKWLIDNFEDLTGYSHEEFASVGRAGLVHPDDLDKALRYVDGPLGTNEHEFRIVTKQGELRWLEERMRVEEIDGVLRVLGATRDVTRRKRAEEQRLELEQRAMRAQKLESLGVLSSGLAHDFNNLLTGIVGNLELALEDVEPNSDPGECIEQALRGTRRAADLINQMLIYAGRGKAGTEVIDLNAIVREMVSLVRASSQGAVLAFELAEHPLVIKADPTQIRRIVMNLVTNAAQAVDAGGRIVVRSELADGMVRLQVADDGHGMDEPTVARIFDPFFTTKSAGTGLGLSAVHGIVQRHGGHLRVDSRLNEGTTFTVAFPHHGGTLDDTDDIDGSAFSGSGSVLVIDDEEAVRRVAAIILRRSGFEVLEASCGMRGVELLRDNPHVACVLLDWRMPEMDGVATYELLRAVHADVPVILCSGNRDQALEHFDRDGLAGVIAKPYALEQFRSVLRSVLQPTS